MRNERFLIGESSLLMRSWLFLIRGSQTPTRNELLLLVGSAFQIRNSLPYGAIRVTIKRFNKEAMATSSGFFGSHAWAIQANEQPLCREVNASEAALTHTASLHSHLFLHGEYIPLRVTGAC